MLILHIFPLCLSLYFLSCPVTHTGGCRTHLWRQPGTSAPSQASQRWKTQVSGERVKTVNGENMLTRTYCYM